MARSKLHRRYARNPGDTHNPPLFTDLVQFVAPGFAGFAATRFATYVASTQIAKRAPKWAKHAGAASSVGSFLGAWFLAHKVKWLEKYHTPLVVGSAIAMLQSLIQLYVPRLGWMISDASPEITTGAAAGALTAQQPPMQQLRPTDYDPNEFTYNDEFDQGRYAPTGVSPKASSATSGPGGPAPQDADDDDLPDLADLTMDDAIGTANLGVFANNN